jgi:hypothetical protein
MKTTTTQAPETVTRYVGECQMCGNRQKVSSPTGTVAFHGYKRPGGGSTYGRCSGTDCQPYELSCDAIKDGVVRVVRDLEATRAYMASLEAGTVTYLVEARQRGQRFETVQFAVGVSAPVVWVNAMARAVRATGQNIRGMVEMIAWMNARIAAWQPGQVQEIDERGHTATDRAAQDKRRQDRADAKAAAATKKADREAKQEARKVESLRILAEAGAKIRAIDLTAPDAQAQALAILRNLNKVKNRPLLNACGTFMWESCLNADDALRAMGLTDGTYPSGKPVYKTPLWY